MEQQCKCFHIKGMEGGGGGGSSYLLRVEKVVLVPLRVVSLKRSTGDAFVAAFRVLSGKIFDRR